MRILQVIPYFTPRRGGDVNVCSNVAMQLSRLGHEVTIVTTDFELDRNLVNVVEGSGVKVVRFPVELNISLFLITPQMKRWMKREIKNFDIVHAHDSRTYQNILVRKYAIRHRIPYIIQAHGSALPFLEKIWIKKLYDLIWGNSILRDASTLLAVAETEIGQYETAGARRDKIVLIPNGIEKARFSQSPAKGLFRKRIGIDEAKKLILYQGRLHKRKGIDFLLDSFALMNDKNCILTISGPDDGEKALLEERSERLGVASRVKFTGFINNVSEAYVDADVVVYPASNEIFGLVPLEALLCGTQVIVADEGGCGDLIRKMNGGYLVRYGDIIGLSQVMTHSLNHPEEGRKMIENAKKYIINNLTWEKIATKIEESYENCIRDF